VFLQGFIRKRRQDIKDVGGKKHIPSWNQVEKDLEDTRR
jgi:hypothetical protein